MYAMQHAIDRLKKNPDDIRVVNVGGLNVLPDILETEASLLEWIKRLPSLYKPSKTHTMNNQAQEILQLQGHRFYDFSWQVSGDAWTELYMKKTRKDKLVQISQWLIQKNMSSIDRLLNFIIKEKFCPDKA